MAKIVLSLFAFLVLATAAWADGELERRITPHDRQRLDGFEATLKDALAEARAGGRPEDLAVLDAALAGSPLPLASGFDPVGNWRCRTLKLGGGLPLVVYGWFRCRISDDGAGWLLEKLTGSQRTRGSFFTLSDTRLAYLGAGYVAGEAPRRYGDDTQENQVAIAERRAENRIILLFPAPHYESKLDVLVLER
ncbi:DUF4893 domain-containing protein [Aestuariivirga sp.]|uniref:DUF4893 domain-containing protein n=1 Tax=Aestuariivirga sp. TaxID=2650926 RepID=UPI00391ACDFA